MALEFEQPESIEQQSTRCSKAGSYHVVVTDYIENPEKKNGGIVEGGFEITCEIADGTEKSEIGKTLKTTFYPPNEMQKDQGKFCLLRMTKFYLAINRGAHQPGAKAVLNFETVVGRQFIAKVVVKDEKYFEFDGVNTWHVDDLLVADIPKSEEYLQHIPEELRIMADAAATSGNANLDDL